MCRGATLRVVARLILDGSQVEVITAERVKRLVEQFNCSIFKLSDFVEVFKREFGEIISRVQLSQRLRVDVGNSSVWSFYAWVIVVLILLLAGVKLEDVDCFIPRSYFRLKDFFGGNLSEVYGYFKLSGGVLYFGVMHYRSRVDLEGRGEQFLEALGLQNLFRELEFGFMHNIGMPLFVLSDCVALKYVSWKGGVFYEFTKEGVKTLFVSPIMRVGVDSEVVRFNYEEYEEMYPLIASSPGLYYQFRKSWERKVELENIFVRVWFSEFVRTKRGAHSRVLEGYGVLAPHVFYDLSCMGYYDCDGVELILSKEEFQAVLESLTYFRSFVAEDLWFAVWLDLVGVGSWGPAIFVAIKDDTEQKYEIRRLPIRLVGASRVSKRDVGNLPRRIFDRQYYRLDFEVACGRKKVLHIPVLLGEREFERIFKKLKRRGYLREVRRLKALGVKRPKAWFEG